MIELIKQFFGWLGGVLADPNDDQGSVKRLIAFMFISNMMLILTWLTYLEGKLPTIPESILNLTYFIIGGCLLGIAIDRSIAAYKSAFNPQPEQQISKGGESDSLAIK